MARLRAPILLLPVFTALMLTHVYVSPYTKVEESFNIQAAHDIFHYGIPLGSDRYLRFKALFDHMTFPGAVPRTFIGAMTLSAFAKPFMWLVGSHDGLHQQMLGEFVYGLQSISYLIMVA
jgi:alpha-1,6-mannosyltransferase